MAKKYNSDSSNEIVLFLENRGIKKNHVAKKLGFNRQNFDGLLERGTIKADQYKKIAEMGGVEVSLN